MADRRTAAAPRKEVLHTVLRTDRAHANCLLCQPAAEARSEPNPLA
jgi:hypothetical protein